MAFQVFKFYFNLKKILNTCLKTAYGKQLVSSFREEGMKKFGLEHYKKFNGAPIDVFGRSGSEPTFWEFVQGIVREGRSQNHFHILASCSWCSSFQAKTLA